MGYDGLRLVVIGVNQSERNFSYWLRVEKKRKTTTVRIQRLLIPKKRLFRVNSPNYFFYFDFLHTRVHTRTHTHTITYTVIVKKETRKNVLFAKPVREMDADIVWKNRCPAPLLLLLPLRREKLAADSADRLNAVAARRTLVARALFRSLGSSLLLPSPFTQPTILCRHRRQCSSRGVPADQRTFVKRARNSYVARTT